MSIDPRYHEDGLTLYCGDARDVLATLPADSIDCVVTSPPYYGLRNYDGDSVSPTDYEYAKKRTLGTGRSTLEGGRETAIVAKAAQAAMDGLIQTSGSWRGGDMECEHDSAKRPTRFGRGGLSEKQASNSGSDGDEETLRSMACDCGALFVPSGAVWGGDPACAHAWGAEERGRRKDLKPPSESESTGRMGSDERQGIGPMSGGNFCVGCGAWRGALGREPTPELYVEHIVEIFRDVRRTLKPTGTVWLNLGDSFSSGGRKSYDGSLVSGSGVRNSSAGLERNTPAWAKPKDLLGIPWRVAFALQADGWYLRRDIIWNKPNPMPESVTDRPTSTHEYIFLLTKEARYFYDAFAIREPSQSGPSDRRKMAEQLDRIGGKHKTLDDAMNKANKATNIGQKRGVGDPAGRNARSVWTIATTPSKLPHFAAFPEKLVEPCIKAGTSEHGACGDCGAPYTRIVKRTRAPRGDAFGVKDVGENDHGQAGSPYMETVAAESVGFEHAVEPANLRNRNNGTAKFDFHERQVGAGQKLQAWMDENPQTTVGWTGCDDAPVVPCVVLDPFVGTGSTLKVARDLGRHAIGIDVSEQYIGLATHRLRYGERGALAISKGQMELA